MSETQANEGDEVVWWLKWATRGVGACGAVASGVCGILIIVENILTPTCIASGAIMVLLSFLLFVFEATFCCAKVSAAQPLISRMEKLRFWHRAALYCGLSVLSLGLCLSAPLTHVFGLLGGFACGVLYGIMSLGKKADQAQLTVGLFAVAMTPLLYYVAELFYKQLSVREKRENSIQQWIRVLCSLLLACACWAECFVAVQTYFTEGNVELAGLIGPAIFSLVPVLAIFFQLFETAFTIGGSGVVLFYYTVAMVTTFPTFVTASTYFKRRELIHQSEQFQRALNFCIIEFCLLVLCSLTQLLPDISSKKKEAKAAWEEDATLFGRLTFGWFSRLIFLSNEKTVTVDDLPDVPHYLKGDESHKVFAEMSKGAKEKVFFIEKPKARGAKKKKEEAKKNADEDKSLLAKKEDEAKVDKKTAEIIELPRPNFRCRQKSLLAILVKTYWRPFALSALFKLGHDLLAFAMPQLLKLFIRWIETENHSVQWGYIYSAALFVVPVCQTVFLHQYFWLGNSNGLMIKNALTSEIYRKSVVLASRSRAIYTHGEIVNLMSVDAQKFQDVSTYLHMIWSGPLQISLSLYFLYQELGPSLFAGIGVMLILIPINSKVFQIIGAVMRDLMQFKDKRMKALSEMINSMKIVKLYAWEPFFEEWIHQIRLDELANLWRKAIAGIWAGISWSVAPFLVLIAAFTTYIYTDLENHILTPEKAFVSITYFDLLRFPMQMLPMIYIQMVELMVSVRRLQNFINLPEQETGSDNGEEKDEKVKKGTIVVKGGDFKWEKSAEENTLSDINLTINQGELVAVVGHIGSGKSSLVAACLNEMEKCAGEVRLSGSVGYVPQEAWLQNATVEENITFGSKMNRQYYTKCIDAAALTTDLSLLPSGDQTEIGEKGINLSGGQKQRVSLARAAYNAPDIVLLDDPLSAVDPHVAYEIFDKLISNDKSVLRHKTRLLVTHATQFLPRCDRIILLAKGKIVDQGKYQAVYDANPTFHPILKSNVEERNEDSDEAVSPTQSVDTIKSSASKAEAGKLTQAEETKEGTVEWAVFKTYFTKYGMHFIAAYLLLNTFRSSFFIAENLWLADWSNDAKLIKASMENGSNVASSDLMPTGTRLGLYAFFGLIQAVFVVANTLISAKGGIRASRKLHDDLVSALVRFPISYYDKTPSGRILNRCGKDIETVDTSLVRAIDMWMFSGYRVVFGLLAVCIASPYYIFAMPPFFCLYWYIQRIFVKTTRQLKRIESVSKSPIYAHFGETINGATTIRAYGHKERFIGENLRLIDINSQANYYGSVIAYRWLAVRLECLSHILVLIAALIFVLNDDYVTAGMVGFALSTSIRMSQTLNWFVRQTSELETYIVSVERLTEYSDNRDDFPFEAQSDTKVADNWLDKGKIELKNFSLHYKKDNPAALDRLELTIEAGERIGVCGRTGSGKSSLLVSLFRLFEPDSDSVYEIDGVDCTELPLDALRRKLTIIPQDPILFSNTLRRNLDPFNQFDDEAIYEALRLAHLSTFVREELESGLDHKIAEGGANLSAGQRQLICLARALLRKTKILVLDEATASVDSETDQLVQGTIRAEFKNVTILAVAHRIETIDDYDKILVLDQGKIAEFDTPANLKANADGIYRSMYDAAVGAKKDN